MPRCGGCSRAGRTRDDGAWPGSLGHAGAALDAACGGIDHLGRLPIDSLKIDRSFVAALHEGRQNVEIVRAMLTMGRTLGHKVIAEGVETQAQLDLLRELGVAEAQGCLLSRPISAGQVEALLAADGRAAVADPGPAAQPNRPGARAGSSSSL